jgi:predicted transcriptional regulator
MAATREAVLTRVDGALKAKLEELAKRNSRSVSAELCIAARERVEREQVKA